MVTIIPVPALVTTALSDTGNTSPAANKDDISYTPGVIIPIPASADRAKSETPNERVLRLGKELADIRSIAGEPGKSADPAVTRAWADVRRLTAHGLTAKKDCERAIASIKPGDSKSYQAAREASRKYSDAMERVIRAYEEVITTRAATPRTARSIEPPPNLTGQEVIEVRIAPLLSNPDTPAPISQQGDSSTTPLNTDNSPIDHARLHSTLRAIRMGMGNSGAPPLLILGGGASLVMLAASGAPMTEKNVIDTLIPAGIASMAVDAGEALTLAGYNRIGALLGPVGIGVALLIPIGKDIYQIRSSGKSLLDPDSIARLRVTGAQTGFGFAGCLAGAALCLPGGPWGSAACCVLLGTPASYVGGKLAE